METKENCVAVLLAKKSPRGFSLESKKGNIIIDYLPYVVILIIAVIFFLILIYMIYKGGLGAIANPPTKTLKL